MEFPIQLVILLIFAALASAIAHSKGRSAIGWFFGGFFLGLIGVIIVAVLPNLKEQKEKEERIELENRRLREQLNQERMKGEVFRRHASARLDAHDGRLGVDTRQTLPGSDGQAVPLLGGGGGVSLGVGGETDDGETLDLLELVESGAAVVGTTGGGGAGSGGGVGGIGVSGGSRGWHYEKEGATVGPISEAQLIDLFSSGRLKGSTLVWTEGLDQWTPAAEIRGIKPFVQS